MDLYLKFSDEQQANEVLYNEVRQTYTPVEINDDALVSHLDTLPLRDAQYDQVVDYDGKLYMADAGKWFELQDVTYGYTANYANIDTIGVIYQPQDIPDPENPPEPVPYDGFFVNIRVVSGENAEPLMPYSIDPQPYPMRVWG